jgi:small subunit ribosomal protein S8
MSHGDPIADMLTRIRNAVRVDRQEVTVQATGVVEGIARVLKEQGYINGYDRIATGHHQDVLRIQLRYGPLGEQVVRAIKRCSKPSRRVYCAVGDLPQVMGGLGIAVVSTSQGVLSDAECRQRHLGGELLCTVC